MQLLIHFASLFNVCKFAAHERIPIRISWHTNYIYPSYPDAFPFGIITMPYLSDCQFGAMHRVCIPWNLFAPKNSSKNICNVNLIQEIPGKIHFHNSGLLLHLTVTWHLQRITDREREKEIENIISTEYLWSYIVHVRMHECKYSITLQTFIK